MEAHHHNTTAAKLAVESLKYHIILHTAFLDANRPVKPWGEMIPQTEDTLNMLLTLQNNINLTAYKELNS
jgi:hypothetical protein